MQEGFHSVVEILDGAGGLPVDRGAFVTKTKNPNSCTMSLIVAKETQPWVVAASAHGSRLNVGHSEKQARLFLICRSRS